MPRGDRFIDPITNPIRSGLERAKHFAEDTYDYVTHPQHQQRSGISSWFTRPSEPAAARLGSFAGGKIGQKVGEAFGRHGEDHQDRSGFFGRSHGGYYEEEPGFFVKSLDYIEREILNRPLLFVAYPLVLGLFVSSWAHRQVRLNRAWFDKITLPSNIPPAWLYDPMWTVVLTCMGYASYLVFREVGLGDWSGLFSLGFYNLSVMTLFAWPVLFFNWHESILAPIVATVLTGLMMITNGLFFSHSTTAGLLLLPATIWIAYMMVINWQVFKSNQGLRLGQAAGTKEKGDWPWSATATSAVAGSNVVTAESREAKKVR